MSFTGTASYSSCALLPTQPPPYSVATAQGSTLSGRISTPLARPQTRYQTRAEQQKAEQERVQAFSKVGGGHSHGPEGRARTQCYVWEGGANALITS